LGKGRRCHFNFTEVRSSEPGTSALCILVKDHFERVLEEVKSFKGKVLHTPLLHTDEAKLKAALAKIKTEAGA
jgi:uncharacterized membrane protein